MRHRQLIALTLFSLSMLAGCAADTTQDDASESENEIRTRSGLVLVGEGGLSVAVRNERSDGSDMAPVKRARVTRAGRSFDAYCNDLEVDLGTTPPTTRLGCWKFTRTVSEDQKLAFAFVKRGDVVTLESVALAGTELSRDRETLLGARQAPLAIRLDRASMALNENPFAAAAAAEQAVAPLKGARAYDARANRERTVGSIRFTINEHYDVSARIDLRGGPKDVTASDFSMLVRRFDLRSGFVNPAELATRALAALPRAPTCEMSGPAGSVASPVPSITNAFSPLGGPSHGLATEVELADLPAAVRSEARKAIAEIQARSFDGSDYAADVAGIYAIHASCTDQIGRAHV